MGLGPARVAGGREVMVFTDEAELERGVVRDIIHAVVWSASFNVTTLGQCDLLEFPDAICEQLKNLCRDRVTFICLMEQCLQG